MGLESDGPCPDGLPGVSVTPPSSPHLALGRAHDLGLLGLLSRGKLALCQSLIRHCACSGDIHLQGRPKPALRLQQIISTTQREGARQVLEAMTGRGRGAYLDANEEAVFPGGVSHRGDGEHIPEGLAILPVVQQPDSGFCLLFNRISDLIDRLPICVRALHAFIRSVPSSPDYQAQLWGNSRVQQCFCSCVAKDLPH